MKINKNASLVTSRFEEKAIQKRCDELDVGLIPKSKIEDQKSIEIVKKGLKKTIYKPAFPRSY